MDKSFQQAIQDLQDRLLNGFQNTIFHMIGHRTTVAAAASGIQDERVRAIVTKTLIVEQITMLLALVRGMHIISDAQYNEFVDYLTHSSTTYQPHMITSRETDTV
jgi:hypothetical protein